MKSNFLTLQSIIIILALTVNTYTWNTQYIHSQPSDVIKSNKELLLQLPSIKDEIASSIVKKALIETIKLALSLSPNDTDEFFIEVGKMCRPYLPKEKNTMMRKLLRKIYADVSYGKIRPAALLLTYAGAQNDAYPSYSLLFTAVQNQDISMIKALFENNTNPNQKHRCIPIFYNCNTLPVTKLFIKQKNINLNTKGSKTTPNVLFACLLWGHSPKIVRLYLKHKVDATIKDNNNNSLLHRLAKLNTPHYKCQDYKKVAKLLLTANPTLIHELNNNKRTPLDKIEKKYKQNKGTVKEQLIQQSLIKFFIKNGAKNSTTLNQKNYQEC